MKRELRKNAMALRVGFGFAFVSIMFFLSRKKSEYWYAKKAKYAALLTSLTQIEPDNSVEKSASVSVSSAQTHLSKEQINFIRPKINALSEKNTETVFN